MANFTAYGFAPPILVTPMGAFTVVVSTGLSTLVGESLPQRGWLGCGLSVLGAAFLVLNAPRDPEIHSMDAMVQLVEQPSFLFYAAGTLSLATTLACAAPTHGQFSELVVLVLICSLVGSMSVLSCKALSISIRISLENGRGIFSPASSGAASLVAVCIILQLNYLNRALDAFGTSRVAPVYYVFFTTLTLVAAFVLYKEWERTSICNGLFILLGLAAIASGVKLLHDPETKGSESQKVGSEEALLA